MNSLRITLLFLGLSFLIFSFCINESLVQSSRGKGTKLPVAFKTEFLKEAWYPAPVSKKDTIRDSIKVYCLHASVKNTSSETVYFLSVTCAYEEMFVVKNSTHFKIFSPGTCKINNPTLITLKPDETYSREIMIQPIVKPALIPETADIGFEFIPFVKGQEFDVIDSYQGRHAGGNTIWSEPVQLKKKGL